MIQCEVITKKHGELIGIIFPKKMVEKEGIKEGEKIRLLIIKDNMALKQTFGILKGKLRKSAQKIKDEARKELYND